MDAQFYMNKCLQLARLGEYYVAPNPMVGAILVESVECRVESSLKVESLKRREKIVGEGWHKEFGGAHAEVNCFRDAEERGITDFSQCTLYVSLEPCSHYGKTPPCAKLIIEKGVKKVVVGMLDPNSLVAGKGIAMLRDAGIEVEVGVMEAECRKLNKRFLMLHEHHRPYVILKWAETLDGYIDRYAERPADAASPERPLSLKDRSKAPDGPLVISTPVTKQLVHKMRAENMAIMVGTNTVIKDNPKLNVTRWVGRNPIRVTVDRNGRIGKEFHILDDSAETIVYRDNTDWTYIVSDLAKRGIHSIMVEGGTTLLNHILATGIYDEIHIEVSDVRIGEGVAAPKIELPNEYEIIDNHRIYCIYK